MYITRYTDYSLRVLMYLALKGEEQSTIREIADSYNISKNHLMKVVHALSLKGYVIAQRGKNGGLRLSGHAKDINIGKLIRDIEKDSALVECFNGGTGCILTPACQLKTVLAIALEAFFKTLDKYSLADLAPKSHQPELTRLLGISN